VGIYGFLGLENLSFVLNAVVRIGIGRKNADTANFIEHFGHLTYTGGAFYIILALPLLL